MEKRLYKMFKLKLILTALIMIIIAALVSGSILFVKAVNTNEQIRKIEREKNNRYSFANIDDLTFLSKKQTEKYKKEIIGACEAYNLENVSRISIDNKSIDFDKTANIYTWKVSCNDKRNVKFISAYKKSTGVFSSELDRIDEVKEAEQDRETQKKEACTIENITFPKDHKFLKTKDQQKSLKEDLSEYLSVEEVSEIESVTFDRYEDKEKTKLYYKAWGSKPIYIEGIIVRYDKNGDHTYEIKKEASDEQ